MIPLHPTAPAVVRKPTAVNFQVNDICNARCVMCGVWRHRRDRELTPAEFAALMADPYFSEVEHVGITGGEPTLKRDLAEYYLVLPDACPRLTGASFITHGFETDRALAAYTRVAEAYRARGLEFHGMVSIDGLEAVHDQVRGRRGAFAKATRTLFGLKAAGIPTSACCTIVRSNVWHLQDLLDWGYDKTYIRFRIAEFINRLSNAGATQEIRAFDAAERASLISFFTSLIRQYEPDESVRRTYASIVTMLAGGQRRIGCPYQDGRAMNLDCRGRFAVCAPKGRPHPLGPDAIGSVSAAEAERQTIAATHCPDCIHDYHDDWRPEIAAEEAAAQAVRRHLAQLPSADSDAAVSASVGVRTPHVVVVLGWYGTETIGDLAILMRLLEETRSRWPGADVIVPSQFPDFTRHNAARLGLDCRVVSYGDHELIGDLWGAGTVMIGGGPLMDIPELAAVASIFERASRLGCHTIVEGCGVGPVHLAETADRIRRIGHAAREIRVRDRHSAAALAALGIAREIAVTDDPAARWVRSTGMRHQGDASGPVVVFARELTHEYPQPTTPAAATAALTSLVRGLCDAYPERRIELHAMHHFPVGGDDRHYARRLARLAGRDTCTVDQVPRTPLETLQIMSQASLVVCMRFHSLVFAHQIGAPILAIDYTNGGKVAGYLSDHGLPPALTLAELSAGNTSSIAAIAGVPPR